MARIRFGLIGYGKIAALHAQAIARSEHAELVSVCGRDAAKRDRFAQTWKIASRDSVADMVRYDRVDAVMIATPHPRHHEDALEAFAAGCHVLVEKPMAVSVEQAQAMLEAAAKAGRQLAVISQRRWNPACQRIKQAIQAGKLGKPAVCQVSVLGWRDQAYYSSDPWRGSWTTEGGGIVINQASHQLDLMNWFMGPVAEIQAYWDNINHPYIEVEDTAVAIIRFKSGAMASLLVSNSQKPGLYAKVHVHGSSAASVGVQTDGGAMFLPGQSTIPEPPLNDLWTIAGEEHLLEQFVREDKEFYRTIDPFTWFFSAQIDDFAQAVLTGSRPLCSGEDGLETVKVIEGIYRSGHTGAAIRW